jgi:hypothetical protein
MNIVVAALVNERVDAASTRRWGLVGIGLLFLIIGASVLLWPQAWISVYEALLPGTKKQVDRSTTVGNALYLVSWRVLPAIFTLAGAGMVIGGIVQVITG